jgi:peptidylprolyl isomerase
VSSLMSDKPLVEPHLDPAPDDLLIEEIVVGTGEEAQIGRTAVVHYVGVGVTSGEQFDASWDRDEPFVFPLGAGYVIQGWDRGVVGMKVGGRRRLVIPAHLGYGERGAGSVIAPNETLIFVVDLLELR